MSLLITNARVWQWQSTNLTDISGSFVDLNILVEDGVITQTNSPSTPLELPSNTTTLDYKNKIVIPGLIDSHIHVGMTGETKYFVDLSSCTSIESFKSVLKKHVEKHPHMSVIQGVGWDQEKLGRFPTASDLDEIITTKPVWLWRACWHIGVGNTNAMLACNASSWSGEGGVVEKTPSPNPVPTGVLKERACEIINPVLGAKSDSEKRSLILDGLKMCSAMGVTAVATNEMNECVPVYKALHSENLLPTRVFLTPMAEELESNPDLSPFSTDDRILKVERVKIFGDGSLGAGTAAIAPDEETGHENKTGVLIFSDKEMERKIVLAKERGFRLEIHAIGDMAAEQVLNALEKCKISPQSRPVLTHCQVLRRDLIDKMKELNVVANVQPSFVPTDMAWVQKRLSESKQEYSYIWKTLLKEGVWVAGGSDSPVETPSPLVGMYDAMYRRSRNNDDDVFKPEEKLTFAEALWLYTIGGAYASMEPTLGSISPGKTADLVILDGKIEQNYTLLKTATPRAVIVGGKIIVDNNDEDEALTKIKMTTMEGPFIPGKGGGFFCACVLRGKQCFLPK
ncbi:hypothetical protein TL16_g07166 [Triparma laevis f. inornata]|uniref:Amidohydrolase 3 domain-containing protein n=2 Tax=Triparma laevis TaxID=1534972 RepID=A0A9W7KYY5_9STRA|nr:hypothetical protein TL16_g07166 [Triparma laevis f. inornata]GMI17042.1 hypothetical protein TrLO_g15321 [Triparma laevis f. longispina]